MLARNVDFRWPVPAAVLRNMLRTAEGSLWLDKDPEKTFIGRIGRRNELINSREGSVEDSPGGRESSSLDGPWHFILFPFDGPFQQWRGHENCE